MKKKYVLFSLILLFTFISCTSMEKKYSYVAKSCYANGYRCEVVFGSKVGEAIISTNVGADWGAGGGLMSFGTDPMALPDTIRLIYYSLPENQFYRLKAPLPQERIKELLEKRYPREKGDDLSYQSFVVGMAPKGYVALWLLGDAGWVYIDSFQAEKIDMDYNRAFPTRGWNREKAFDRHSKNLFTFIRREMKSDSLSPQYWKDLTKTYNWKLRIADKQFQVYDYGASTINVERFIIETSDNWLFTQSLKGIPAELTLYLKHDLDPIRYKISLVFEQAVLSYNSNTSEEDQVLRHMNKNRRLMYIFEEFCVQAGNEEVELVIELNDAMTELCIKLKSQNHEMDITEECSYKIYPSDKYRL